MIRAVLFDFNGVLLLDGKWHEQAWNELSKKLRNKILTSEEIRKHVQGRTPQDTLKFLLGRVPTQKEAKDYLNEKENLYQKLALEANFELTPGAIELLESLRSKGIKINIATSSPLVLVKFYYKYLNLEKWFPFENIVYNDGTFPGKPAPDIFLKAAEKIDVDIKDCSVIEDATSGVESARKAGAGEIVLFLNGENSETSKNVKVDKMVSNFSDII